MKFIGNTHKIKIQVSQLNLRRKRFSNIIYRSFLMDDKLKTMDENENWYNILDQVLQCPVCLDIPQSKVMQCTLGHHICHFCYSKLSQCPICEKNFIATRNLLGQDLISCLKDVKVSVENLLENMKKKYLQYICEYKKEMYEKQVESVSTQTDFATIKVCCSTQTTENSLKCFVQNTKNRQTTDSIISYPCLIGSCTVRLSYVGLIKHLREFHKHIFYEVQLNELTFSENFTIKTNELPKTYDFAYRINNMGLFFFNMTINNTGKFIASVQLVNNNVSRKPIQCELIIKNKNFMSQRHGTVTLYEENKGTASVYRFCIPTEQMLQMMKYESFECTLVIRTR